MSLHVFYSPRPYSILLILKRFNLLSTFQGNFIKKIDKISALHSFSFTVCFVLLKISVYFHHSYYIEFHIHTVNSVVYVFTDASFPLS